MLFEAVYHIMVAYVSSLTILKNTVGNIFKFLHLLMFLEVHISCKRISYNTTSEVHSLCQVLNPLFGYTKGSVLEAAIQVSKEEFMFLSCQLIA